MKMQITVEADVFEHYDELYAFAKGLDYHCLLVHLEEVLEKKIEEELHPRTTTQLQEVLEILQKGF